jgi:AcrR family transcriptional regulator
MGRPRVHGDQTADALLEAAERRAAADGPGSLSVRGVAEEVGTTTRAVYSLFGSKDGLLVALAVRGFELLATEVEAAPISDDPLDDVVCAGAVVFRRFVLSHPVLFRIGFQRESVTPDLVARFDDARRMALAQITVRLERLAAGGQLGAHTPRRAALYFHALCEGLATLELRGALPAQHPESVWCTALRALVVGLGEDPAAPAHELS